jgi:hypothetical protein
MPMEYAGNVYQVMNVPIHREKDSHALLFQYGSTGPRRRTISVYLRSRCRLWR